MENSEPPKNVPENAEIERIKALMIENSEMYERKRENLQRLQDKYGVVHERNGGMTVLLGNEQWFSAETKVLPW